MLDTPFFSFTDMRCSPFFPAMLPDLICRLHAHANGCVLVEFGSNEQKLEGIRVQGTRAREQGRSEQENGFRHLQK